jgi:predicted dehydrogenase
VGLVQADFGFRTEFDPKSRFFDPALGGGALLDVGIYPISLASMVFGQQPDYISSQAHLGHTGVDEVCGAVFRYEGGQMALVSAAVRMDMPWEAVIMGTKGRIHIHRPFWIAERFTLVVEGRQDEVIHVPMMGNGYTHEAAHVMACMRAGKLESEVMPLTETLAIMGTLDRIRAQWGLKYPGE